MRYHFVVHGVTAFVLAGGRSSRMGADKALLLFRGQTLLQRTLQTAAAVAARTAIVGSQQRYAAFGEVIEDVYAGCGPLAGIHAALAATVTDLNLMLSVDLPLMTAEFLAWLVHQASQASESIVVPDALGGLQPLCAVYRRDVLPVAEQGLKHGTYKIGHLFAVVPTRYIGEQKIVEAGFSTDLFLNINTPAEYDGLSAAACEWNETNAKGDLAN